MQIKTFFDIIFFKREMKHPFLFFCLCVLLTAPYSSMAATCSRINLTQCLDSACAINISSNPAARCQYCGTASAGSPSSSAMRSVSLGVSSKYILSEKELKSAPSDPGQRYAWATAECIKKISGCTADDVSEVYDSLIEQSCKAAGITAEMTSLSANLKQTVSKTSCSDQIQSCLVADNKCGANFSGCKEDVSFNSFFASCSVEATGCDEYLSDIRTDLRSSRDNAIANAQTLIDNVAKAYQNARAQKLSSAESSCTNDAGFNACVQTVCAQHMKNKCDSDYESERVMAETLCRFYKTACQLIE